MKKLLLLIIGFQTAFSQSIVLKNYIEEGLESNLALKQQSFEIEKSIKAIEIARSNIYPKIAFSPTYTLAAGGRKLSFPIGDLLNPVYNTLNKLTQSSSFPTVDNQVIQFAPNNFHETVFKFSLPLLNTDIRENINIQKIISQGEFTKKKTLEHEIKHQITAGYLQYLQSMEAIKLYEQGESFLKSYIDFNQRLLKNEVGLKDAVLSAEFELNRLSTDKAEAIKNTHVAKAYFNFLLNKPYDNEILIDSMALVSSAIGKPLETYHQEALSQRPEFNQIRNGIAANNGLIALQEKNARLPTVFLGGNTGFQGFGYEFKDQAYLVAQIGLNWDLYHGKEKKHKIEQSKLQTKVLETKNQEIEQQIKMQVSKAFLEWQGAQNVYEASSKSVQTTHELLRFIEKKYKNQNAIYIEVLKAQNDHLMANLKNSLARYTQALKFAELQKTVGN